MHKLSLQYSLQFIFVLHNLRNCVINSPWFQPSFVKNLPIYYIYKMINLYDVHYYIFLDYPLRIATWWHSLCSGHLRLLKKSLKFRFRENSAKKESFYGRKNYDNDTRGVSYVFLFIPCAPQLFSFNLKLVVASSFVLFRVFDSYRWCIHLPTRSFQSSLFLYLAATDMLITPTPSLYSRN